MTAPLTDAEIDYLEHRVASTVGVQVGATEGWQLMCLALLAQHCQLVMPRLLAEVRAYRAPVVIRGEVTPEMMAAIKAGGVGQIIPYRDERERKLAEENTRLRAAIAELGTDDQLAELVALVNRATEGPWQFGQPKVATEAEAVEWFLHAYRGGPEGSFWTNWVPDADPQRPGDSSLFVAITGNGPTSEANARFISMARSVLPLLLAKVRALVEAGR